MTDQGEVMERIMQEAHERHTKPRKIGAFIASEMDRLLGSGVEWVARVDEDARVDGYMKKASDWRRGQERQAVKVKSGKNADVPAWGSVKGTAEDGKVEYEQLPFERFDAAQVEAYIARQTKARDTYSVSIAAAKAVLATMQEKNLATAGDALAELRRVA